MSAAVEMTHPADETLAAFIDGRLGPEERQPVIEHMVECAECRDIFNTADEFAAEDGEDEVVPIRTRAWLVPVASLAAAAAIGYALFTGPIENRYLAPRRAAALAEAAKADLEQRPLYGRVSLDFGYKEYSPKRSAGVEGTSLAMIRLYTAGAKIEEAVEKHPTPANLHYLGITRLLLKEPGSAIDNFERAVTKETGRGDVGAAIAVSTNAELLNDLAAAYDATGQEDRARAAIARAWELKKSPTIAWTRATILRTKEAWEAYLQLDSTSEWANEARRELSYIDG